MSDSTSVKVGSNGISLLGLTFVVLLVLKLTDLAAISWFWVFFPLILGPAILIAILLGFSLVFLALHIAEKVHWWRRDRRRRKQVLERKL